MRPTLSYLFTVRYLVGWILLAAVSVTGDMRLRMGAAFTTSDIDQQFSPTETGTEFLYQVALSLERNVFFLRPRLIGEIGRYNQRPVYSANAGLHAFYPLPFLALEPALGVGFAHTGYNRRTYPGPLNDPEDKFVRTHTPFYSLSLRYGDRIFCEWDAFPESPLNWKFRLGVIFPEN